LAVELDLVALEGRAGHRHDAAEVQDPGARVALDARAVERGLRVRDLTVEHHTVAAQPVELARQRAAHDGALDRPVGAAEEDPDTPIALDQGLADGERAPRAAVVAALRVDAATELAIERGRAGVADRARLDRGVGLPDGDADGEVPLEDRAADRRDGAA